MSKKYEPNYHQVNEIYLKEIIFEKDFETTDVTIFAYAYNPFEEGLLRVDYCCEFSILNDLLLFANEEGEPIITAITEKLIEESGENPIIIDVENLFGKPLKIEGIVMTIYLPLDENEELEESDSTTLYIIDSVEQEEVFKKQDSEKEDIHKDLSELLILLNNAYLYYTQLIKIGISIKKARKIAGLKDELLFRIAILNNQIID